MKFHEEWYLAQVLERKPKGSFSSVPSEHRQGGCVVDFGSTPNLCVRATKDGQGQSSEQFKWRGVLGKGVREALHVLAGILLQIFQRSLSVCLGWLVNISRPFFFFLTSNSAVQFSIQRFHQDF